VVLKKSVKTRNNRYLGGWIISDLSAYSAGRGAANAKRRRSYDRRRFFIATQS